MLLTGVTNHMDDEYRWAGVEDPKVMITTSRDPSSRLKMFAKVPVVGSEWKMLRDEWPQCYLECVHMQELKLVFPGAQRMNRGRHEVGALVRACKANGVTDLLVVHEHRGTPGKSGGRGQGICRHCGGDHLKAEWVSDGLPGPTSGVYCQPPALRPHCLLHTVQRGHAA